MTFTKEQKTHHLKIYPEHFSAVLTGVKRAELRKNDRDFKVGDTLHLMETPKGSCLPTGEFVNAVVTHIADVGDWFPGYVLLSIEREPGYTAQPAPVLPECYKRLLHHAYGMTMGHDWNKGTMAGHHREKLCQAVEECRAAMLQGAELSQHDELPEGYELVPMKLTAENGAKGALWGEFSETKFINCPECFGDGDCETCDGSGRLKITVPVSWTTIKAIWAKGVEHFAAAAAPQQEA